MPRRNQKATDMREEVLDHCAGPARPMAAADMDAIVRRFKKAIVERMLGGELTHHLGYPPGGLPDRRGRDQADLARAAEYHRDLGPRSQLLAACS